MRFRFTSKLSKVRIHALQSSNRRCTAASAFGSASQMFTLHPSAFASSFSFKKRNNTFKILSQTSRAFAKEISSWETLETCETQSRSLVQLFLKFKFLEFAAETLPTSAWQLDATSS